MARRPSGPQETEIVRDTVVYDIETFEPIIPPERAIKEWVHDDEPPDLWDQTAGSADDWNQSRSGSGLREKDLGDGRILVPCFDWIWRLWKKSRFFADFSCEGGENPYGLGLLPFRYDRHWHTIEAQIPTFDLFVRGLGGRFPPLLSPQPLFSRSPNRSLAPHARQP